MSDEVERKRSTLAGHVADRAAQVRSELSAIGCLDLAEACKERFGARLAYLKTANVELGSNPFPRPGCVWTVYTPPKKRRGQ